MLSKAAEMRGDCAFVLLGKAWQVKRGGKGKLVYLVSREGLSLISTGVSSNASQVLVSCASTALKLKGLCAIMYSAILGLHHELHCPVICR